MMYPEPAEGWAFLFLSMFPCKDLISVEHGLGLRRPCVVSPIRRHDPESTEQVDLLSTGPLEPTLNSEMVLF